jgi:hypothetical protein
LKTANFPVQREKTSRRFIVSRDKEAVNDGSATRRRQRGGKNDRSKYCIIPESEQAKISQTATRVLLPLLLIACAAVLPTSA